MFKLVSVFLIALTASTVSGLSINIEKLEHGFRYQYVLRPDGTPDVVDLWMQIDDLKEAARYNPDAENVYHLFTRSNPTVSQPLVIGSNLGNSNFNGAKRVKVLIHGWLDSVISASNSVLVPAFLNAEDCNVVVVDWYGGAGTINYAAAVENTPLSGASVARFLRWLSTETEGDLANYHIVGHGLGGHQAGIVSRFLDRSVGYVTGLDPASLGWIINSNKFTFNDAVYTEVIHTNAGVQGYMSPLAQVDFYPNGGVNMPGCISQDCDHNRSFYYMAESLTSGGFSGTRCATYITAMAGSCILSGRLNMGGLEPKTGSSGIYYVRTNSVFPWVDMVDRRRHLSAKQWKLGEVLGNTFVV